MPCDEDTSVLTHPRTAMSDATVAIAPGRIGRAALLSKHSVAISQLSIAQQPAKKGTAPLGHKLFDVTHVPIFSSR